MNWKRSLSETPSDHWSLTRKNALFARNEVSSENWALLESIVATCKFNAIDPVVHIAKTSNAIL